MDGMKKVPVREQEPKVRATNFEEVCYGYNEEEAVAEASRCLNCKNARCVQGCPVKIDIPAFVKEVKKEITQRLQRSSADPPRFRLSADVSARRRASVRASVSVASRARLSPSVSSSVSWLTGPERTVLFRRSRRRQTASRSLSSVLVRPVLPVQVISRNSATR